MHVGHVKWITTNQTMHTKGAASVKLDDHVGSESTSFLGLVQNQGHSIIGVTDLVRRGTTRVQRALLDNTR